MGENLKMLLYITSLCLKKLEMVTNIYLIPRMTGIGYNTLETIKMYKNISWG